MFPPKESDEKCTAAQSGPGSLANALIVALKIKETVAEYTVWRAEQNKASPKLSTELFVIKQINGHKPGEIIIRDRYASLDYVKRIIKGYADKVPSEGGFVVKFTEDEAGFEVWMGDTM
jgi:hypothetical protein